MYLAEIFLYRTSPHGSTFTYKVPENLQSGIVKGQLVLVPFGRTILKGIVWNCIETTSQPDFKLRDIQTLLTDYPIVPQQHIKLATWISEYYHASLISVVKTVFPQFLLEKNKKKSSTTSFLRQNQTTISINQTNIELTQEQIQCVKTILSLPSPHNVLLHGVTGSGKTEIYFALMREYFKKNKQVIMLLPEISLTPQMIKRCLENFPPEIVGIWHSELTHNEKRTLFENMQNGTIKLCIGSRSALFAPFNNLGAIIIDEEHETSYKQDTNPRYDARTVAQYLIHLHKAHLILGSATPSVETYYRATYCDNTKKKIVPGAIMEKLPSQPQPHPPSQGSNHWTIINLNKKITTNVKTEQQKLFSTEELIKIIDLRKEPKGTIISTTLREGIQKALDKKTITFLFLNRRGFASYLFCSDCGKSLHCQQCNIPVIYHRTKEKSYLTCHYCGKVYSTITVCTYCKSRNIHYCGFGTQKIEGEVRHLWPEARIARMDRDTMTKKYSVAKLYEQLTSKKIDILIGTQMITKGWDIPNVTTIGVVLADVGLHLPDFRAGEKTYQLLAQVAGRAGRRGEACQVFFQTYLPENEYITFAQTNNYAGLIQHELDMRQILSYPPYNELVRVILEHKDEKKAKEEAYDLAERLSRENKTKPFLLAQPIATPCFITKIKNNFRWNILLKTNKPNHIFPLIPKTWKIDRDPHNLL